MRHTPLVLVLYCLTGALPAYAEPCLTECGMMSLTDTCQDLKDYEKYIIKEMPNHVAGITSEQACTALKGWGILVHPPDEACGGDAWLLSHWLCVYGYTDRHQKIIWLVSSNWHMSSLAHEIIHALDIEFTGDAGHCNWAARGVHRFLRAVARVTKDTPPEDECPEVSAQQTQAQ